MDVDEDVALCKSYISITQDPINGGRQKSSTMWARIYKAFIRAYPNGHSHTVDTLQHRWTQIETNVNIFMGCLARAERMGLGRWTDIEVMAWAKEDYQYYEKESFQFESCYEVLKDTPKFSLSTTRLNNLHHYQDYDFSNVGSSTRRPPERKAAEKERAKKKSKQSMDLQHEQNESDRIRRLELSIRESKLNIRENELNIRIRESEKNIKIRESELNI